MAVALRLPTELCTVIFKLCLQYHGAYLAKPSPREAPLLLTHICRRWRDVCLDTPDLWTSIHFTTGSVELLKLWLSRTGDRLLDVTLNSVHTEKATQLLELIMIQAHRLRAIHLRLPRSVFSRVRGPFPVLERLSIWPGSRDTAAERIVIGDAPMLREARISALEFHSVHLPWAQLTTLHFHPYPFKGSANPIARCPALVNLRIAFSTTVSPSTYTLHHLRSLTLTAHSIMLAPELILPQLETLHIEEVYAFYYLIPSKIRAWLEGRGLSSLTLSTVAQSNADVLQGYLTNLPFSASLVHLKLVVGGFKTFTNEIQALLPANILPGLKHLEVDVRGASADDSELIFHPFFNVLRTQRFESLNLLLRASPGEASMETFRALAQDGMALRMQTCVGGYEVVRIFGTELEEDPPGW
ncbi:hypothetical protein FB45DRAFT_922291 [Roridomyces roridus]|uniref:F-box domain-containing protein n=1 Tax=Roridomyces roridus TaxID=1738132 RepID=A0AAD7BMV0_9AGAR|nr:hypothetical protein FB45DRAFT_922291 [Roridomyces roridus]